MKKVRIILVGWFVILVLGEIFTAFVTMPSLGPNFGVVVYVFVLSIVCTLGLSLIIWIPLGYGVGWIVINILELVKSLITVPASPKNKLLMLTGWLHQELHGVHPGLSRDQLALVIYIEKARRKGLTDDQISAGLQNNGWAPAYINRVFSLAGQASHS